MNETERQIAEMFSHLPPPHYVKNLEYKDFYEMAMICAKENRTDEAISEMLFAEKIYYGYAT